ncbi:MAG: hypothetical protein ACREP7_08025 [Lysobacter sp.]
MPVQNTVTNGVYALLTLRVYQASRDPRFNHVFLAAGLDLDACQRAWLGQIGWLNQWMEATPGDASLLLRTPVGELMRERVSTFQKVTPPGIRYWDAMFRTNLTWTGDQGLLIGALREARAAWNRSLPMPDALGRYPQLLQGVFRLVFKPRSYGAVPGVYPLPWLEYGAADPYRALPPGQDLDISDYLTGIAVFMRYALRAYRADPALLAPYRNQVLACANGIVQSGFGSAVAPVGGCEGFGPEGGAVEDQMTPYVNRLASLLLAIEMAR